jgi:hypothetical protein
MTDRELLQMALEALELTGVEYLTSKEIEHLDALEIALRARLAEPPKDLELPLVRPAEFLKLIQGKENYWGIPVMRTEWPTPEPVIQARKEGDLIVVDLPQVPTGGGGIFKDEQPEPLEYWNAVEGWVKIDEVRQHFDTAGCGTIYKTAGEDRVALYAAPPNKEWVGLPDAEKKDICQEAANEDWTDLDVINATEAKLKEKNGG